MDDEVDGRTMEILGAVLERDLSVVSGRIGLHDLDVAMDRLAAGQELRRPITFDERTPS